MRPMGTYSFLPWLRQGLANQIQSADFDLSVKVRAQVNVQLELRGEKADGGTQTATVSKKVALFGPGDIVGVERRAIVRMEPRHWITNFEPNYLPYIEFYDEDFIWRYTPAAPDLGKGRLRPWLALVVLTEDEFTDGKNMKDKLLPFIDVADLTVFPRADELWAWAHVHVNRSLAANDAEFVSDDMGAVIPMLEAVLGENADLAYSRLVCPRKLAENTAYHAFVIPVFEAGRRAALGLDIGDISATMSAWDPAARPEGQSFPYYHRWFFRTSSAGDFESLVRLLTPKPVDPRVGTREMDLQDPGSNVSPVDKPELAGILKLGGALQPPAKPIDKYDTWDTPFPRPLETDLAHLINLADDYQAAGDPDPIITPPLYGTWHALRKRALNERDGTAILPAENWLHRLNLDPRFRVAAGFGTRIIQDKQEKYMDAAWEQIGRVLEAQRRIRLGRFGMAVSDVWFISHLTPMLAANRQKTLLAIAPLNKRILTGGFTVHHTLSASFVQPPMTSAALRRMVRPRARLIRSLPFDATRTPDQLLERVNRGEVSAAPPKVTPPGILTSDQAAAQVGPQGQSPELLDVLRRFPQLPLVVLLLALLLALLLLLLLPLPLGLVLAVAVVAVGIYLYRRWSQAARAVRASDALREANETPQAIASLPGIAGFKIAAVDSGFVPAAGGVDSVEATRFKQAVSDGFTLLQASIQVGAAVPKTTLDLAQLASGAIAAIKPSQTIPKRVMTGILLPPRILQEMGLSPDLGPAETFVEPMAYPIIDQPMYEPLKDRSSELFLPNINLIEHNSITLLETNHKFIEAYMVGLNHEFARELLWREYPTDQRCSTFRQFWDVRSFFNSGNFNDEDLKEKLRDILPLHRWSLNSGLGEHDNREASTGQKAQVVLVIRGELLKRYPTAVIYAHRACWQRKQVTPADKDKEPCSKSGAIDNTQERRLVELTNAEEDSPPRSKILTPLYEAKVDPDIYFFGFDLTAGDAKGGTGENPTDAPGWFFVIKERPGEPRFGLEPEKQTTLNVWNDLSWPDVQPHAAGSFIEIASAPPAFNLHAPGVADSEKLPQHLEDKKISWSRDMSSAELACVLWRPPVLAAVHASEMLPK